ncbi:MAG: DNA repair protein RadA [Patescibacteria group bacterium]
MYVCSYCDGQHLKWQGRCGECGKWGTLTEEIAQTSKKSKTQEARSAPLIDLTQASLKTVEYKKTGLEELDRVLSGGIVSGSVLLLAGEPGIGKSTLVAQIASSLSGKCLYVSGEESEGQLLMRLERLAVDPKAIIFSNSVEVGSIITAAKGVKPALVIVDSIQTMIPDDVENLPGSPHAVRAATAQLIAFAKSTNIPVLLIGQVTKEGSVAGPKTLEHLVDSVLTIEGEKTTSYRILRASKNRFGTTDEVGVFEMTSKGMIAVANPSQKFLEERQPTPGSIVTCVMEGTRPFLVEVQALAEKSIFANPIRRTSGFDSGRLQMLLAIIGKHTGVKTAGHDVYVNIVGGMKVKETAVDLAVALAVISSIQNKTFFADAVVVGELGLGGEIRSVSFLDRRQKEAERLGLLKFISPKDAKNLKNLI